MPAPLMEPHLGAAIYGDPVYLGTIAATTTSKNNHDTGTPFNDTDEALKGKLLLVQPDVACYVRQADTNAGTASSTNGVKLAADQLFYVSMRSNKGWLACVSVSGSVNLRVFEMNG